MNDKVCISYAEYGILMDEFITALSNLDEKFAAVTALPRGGLPIGVHVSHHFEIPLILNLSQFKREFPNQKLLIVDDIVDTGKTYDRILEIAEARNFEITTATIYYKPHSIYTPEIYLRKTTDWIVFPWETQNELPSKYHQDIYPEIFSDDEPN